MVTVSMTVKKIVENKPLLFEAMSEGIVSFANLAEQLQPEIEREMRESVNAPAIVMALRRYSDQMQAKSTVKKPFKFNSEINMKTGLCDITFVKTPSLLSKLGKVHCLVESERGETLNIIQGNYEVTIVISEKYQKKLLLLLKLEKVTNIENDLVSLTMSFPKEFLYSPGVLSLVTRKIAWEGINVYENISTMTELIYVVKSVDASRAFEVLQRL